MQEICYFNTKNLKVFRPFLVELTLISGLNKTCSFLSSEIYTEKDFFAAFELQLTRCRKEAVNLSLKNRHFRGRVFQITSLRPKSLPNFTPTCSILQSSLTILFKKKFEVAAADEN